MTTRRELGVEFGDLGARLEAHDYPTSRETLVETYGDRTLDLPDGRVRFGDVLAAGDARTFESARAVREATFALLGAEAIAREGYSDRDPPVVGDEDDAGSL